MRILFLAPRLPYPADTGGKIRTFNILRELAQNSSLDLMCFSFDEKDAQFSKELKRLGIQTYLVPAKKDNTIAKILKVLAHPQPFSVCKYYSRQMEEAIQKMMDKNIYDVIHVDHIHMAHYYPLFKGRPCLLDEHNVEYQILERCAKVETNAVKKYLYAMQATKMKTFEQRILKRFHACSAVSKPDKDMLRSLTDRQIPVYVVPNGVDTQYFSTPATSRQSPEQTRKTGDWELGTENASLVFTGSMDWLPNDDAACYFCEAILPLIWRKNKNVKFYIVGKSPSPKIRNLAEKDKRIILTGRVEDVREYVAGAKIFVVPLRIGGGTRLKILEAMSMEKAVVSTGVGAEGIEYTKDLNIAIANTPEDFAAQTLALLSNVRKREEMGREGRMLVLEKYDWQIIGQKLMNIYREIIQ